MNTTNTTNEAAAQGAAVGFTGTELDIFVGAAAALGRPMPAADQALVDEAIRLYALGLTLDGVRV